jgi:hypothetical protein
MDGTGWIAMYGAVVATGGVAWQVASWQLSRRTRIAVVVDYVPEIPTVSMRIYNRSAHDVRIHTINLLWECEGRRAIRMLLNRTAPVLPGDIPEDDPQSVTLRAMSDLPEVIRPHDSGHVIAGGKRLHAVMPLDSCNLRALIGTADGKAFEGRARIYDRARRTFVEA